MKTLDIIFKSIDSKLTPKVKMGYLSAESSILQELVNQISKLCTSKNVNTVDNLNELET